MALEYTSGSTDIVNESVVTAEVKSGWSCRLSPSGSPAHLSSVLVQASWTFQEEIGYSCERGTVCVRRVGDMLKQFVSLAES